MKGFTAIVLLLFTNSFISCGQIGKHDHKEIKTMKTELITNKIAKSAFEAWQNEDAKKWYSLFTTDVKLLDDGDYRDFKQFTTEALGNERFTSIDKVEDGGKSIYGQFHSNRWGDFKTYFKFYLNEEGKINRLEIGLANY